MLVTTLVLCASLLQGPSLDAAQPQQWSFHLKWFGHHKKPAPQLPDPDVMGLMVKAEKAVSSAIDEYPRSILVNVYALMVEADVQALQLDAPGSPDYFEALSDLSDDLHALKHYEWVEDNLNSI